MSLEQTKVIVIGSGIGGLCCASLLAKYKNDVDKNILDITNAPLPTPF